MPRHISMYPSDSDSDSGWITFDNADSLRAYAEYERERPQREAAQRAREEQYERERPQREAAERERVLQLERQRIEQERIRQERLTQEKAIHDRIVNMVTAVQNGDILILKKEYNSQELRYRDPSGRSLLSFAVEADKPEMMKYLINETISNERAGSNTRERMEFLDAVKNNNSEVVIKYLSKYRLRDLTLISHSAPLYVAASKGHLEMVKLLLIADAPINQVNNTHFWSDHYTASHIAAANGHKEVFEFLVKQGANIDLPARWVTAREIANVKMHNTLESLQSCATQKRNHSGA